MTDREAARRTDRKSTALDQQPSSRDESRFRGRVATDDVLNSASRGGLQNDRKLECVWMQHQAGHGYRLDTGRETAFVIENCKWRVDLAWSSGAESGLTVSVLFTDECLRCLRDSVEWSLDTEVLS